MSIGERIKQARSMSALSTRDLGTKVGVSATAISKYERNLDVPSSGVLLRLAQALGVRAEFFLRPAQTGALAPQFRKRHRLPRKEQNTIQARIAEWLERYLEIETLRHLGQVGFSMPVGFPRIVRSLDAVEDAADALRSKWELGTIPIDNLAELLEGRGMKVGLVDAGEDFDACTFQVEMNRQTILVIATRKGLPGDRQRFNLAHELGHLLLKPRPPLDEEDAAHRFAGAFLVPANGAYAELGRHRKQLDWDELYQLKRKYGLSMQAWVYRAKDLGIITESRAVSLFRFFKTRHWQRQEPGDSIPPESPSRFRRLVRQAWVEDIISRAKASELLGEPVAAAFAPTARVAAGEQPN